MDEPTAIGHALAQRHGDTSEPDLDHALGNYAERPRIGDWSMRAALTRYAQPQPKRSARVLTLVRRLDAVLKPTLKPLEKTAVICDRQLETASVDAAPIEPYADTPAADLARLRADDAIDFLTVLGAYEAASGRTLDEAERNAIALLGVALQLDALGDTLANWSNQGHENPPNETVDELSTRVQAMLDETGVPEESPPPGFGRRNRRS